VDMIVMPPVAYVRSNVCGKRENAAMHHQMQICRNPRPIRLTMVAEHPVVLAWLSHYGESACPNHQP
jgi:hypothetical protein